MFRRPRRRRDDVEVIVEDIAGRLRDVLAVRGPHEEKIGHHRTYQGNTDPTKRGLAVVSSPKSRSDFRHCSMRVTPVDDLDVRTLSDEGDEAVFLANLPPRTSSVN